MDDYTRTALQMLKLLLREEEDICLRSASAIVDAQTKGIKERVQKEMSKLDRKYS